MKISTDVILGSAKNINSRRNSKEASSLDKDSNVDKVEITNHVNARLDSIDSELKNLQNSLTKNQTIKAGLAELLDEVKANGNKQDEIIDGTKFNGEKVLADLLKDKELNEFTLRDMQKQVEDDIRQDVAKLTMVKIETENIFASSVPGSDKAENVIRTSETMFIMGEQIATNRLSMLNADVVMKLIK